MIEYLKRRFLPSHWPLCADCKFYNEEHGGQLCRRSFGTRRYVSREVTHSAFQRLAWAQRDALIGDCKPWAKDFEPKDKGAA